MRTRLFPTLILLQHGSSFRSATTFRYASTSISPPSTKVQSIESIKQSGCHTFHCNHAPFHKTTSSRGISSDDSSLLDRWDNVTEKEQQRMRAYDAFSFLARTKKSWQRLGHLVELAADHALISIDGSSSTMSAGNAIADVGTDHGLLAMSFALSGRYERVLGVDLSEEALQNGALSLLNTVMERQDVETRDDDGPQRQQDNNMIPIQFRVSDGFASIAPGEADTVCIAGMGVHTMIKILSMPVDSSGTIHLDRIQCRQLLLQPTNSRPSHMILLYDHLQQSGWRLVDERIEELSKRWYISACFQRIKLYEEENVEPNNTSVDPSGRLELPTSKLVQFEKEDPKYRVFEKYVDHHCQWIEQDAKARGKLKEEDERWLKAFREVAQT